MKKVLKNFIKTSSLIKMIDMKKLMRYIINLILNLLYFKFIARN